MNVYVAFPEFKQELTDEITEIISVQDNLFFSNSDKRTACFAADIWFDAQIVTIESINHAAKILKQYNRRWYAYPCSHYRRAKLIEQQFKNLFLKPLQFPVITQDIYSSTGVFCLLDANRMLFSNTRWRNIPFDIVNFIEDKINPPNRAYLKLWEAFTFMQQLPQPGDIAVDLGAAPGGWTYVLLNLGAHVTAVDKAALDTTLLKHPQLTIISGSAFALNPDDFSNMDWLCADIACYPERLYSLVTKWMNSGKVKNMICTIKLQGKTDLAIIKKFQDLPNASVVHLFYNKHEVTFISCAQPLKY